MPWPGTRSIPPRRSANWVWPWAWAAAIASALVMPAGRREPTAPAKMRSVARPRTMGPVAANATLTTAVAITAVTLAVSGRSRLARRRADGPKSSAFCPII